jgi:hypothetical protein
LRIDECHEFRAGPELAIRRGYYRTTKNAKATKSGGFETRPYIFCALCIAMLKNFRGLRQISGDLTAEALDLRKNPFSRKSAVASI